MFTQNHFIFLGITLAFMGLAFGLIYGLKPKFKTIFIVACVLCVVSELTKTLSVMEFDWVPLVKGGKIIEEQYELVPFIRTQHLPLHLCSIQILFIFLVTFMKPDNKKRDLFLGYMYPTFIIGASLALLMPGTLSFTNPQSWQYFLYHGMLVVLGIYIITSKEVNIRPKHYLTTLALLFSLAFASLYLNSIFAHYTYDQASNTFDLQYIPTFFYTMRSPVAFLFTFKEEWHWYLYLVVIVLLAFILIGLLYLPVFIKWFKQRKHANKN